MPSRRHFARDECPQNIITMPHALPFASSAAADSRHYGTRQHDALPRKATLFVATQHVYRLLLFTRRREPFQTLLRKHDNTLTLFT